MKNDYKYTVSTICMTYNHAQFIEDTLHGFSIQETDFPVVFIVIDDASTDGEPEVLKRWAYDNLAMDDKSLWQDKPYGKRVVASLRGKPQFTFVILLLSDNHYQKRISYKKREYISEWNDNAKYCALCEGDDYWINPFKLQIQVSLLDRTPEASICSGDWAFHEEKSYVSRGNNDREIDYYNYTINDWINKWLTKTLTVMYRTSCLTHGEYVDLRNKYKYFRDVHIFYHLLRKGQGIFVNKVLGCYRKHSGGMFSSISVQEKITVNFLCYKEIYENNQDDESARVLYYRGLLQMIDGNFESYSKNKLLRNAFKVSNTIIERMRVIKHYLMGQ